MPSTPGRSEALRDVTHVFLDVGGTLLAAVPGAADIFHGALSRRGHAVDRDRVMEIWRRGGIVNLIAPVSRDRSREYFRAFNARMVEHLGGTPDEGLLDEIGGTFEAVAWRAYPEVPEILEALQAAGFHLGVISNASHALPAMLAGSGLADFFETVTYSFDAGAEKPDPRIFHRAIAAAGAVPERAVHVGDSFEQDYLGARAVGLHAVLLVREGDPPAPCPTLRGLEGLLELLGAGRSPP
ncbi:MAG TPA: HAD-IA family hydrolase [Thermoplasmata archaeon]|nr:HAD-IA family hydrolase [Thermoplasmata archaeon]